MVNATAQPNLLLSRLPQHIVDDVLADARQVQLKTGQVLAQAGCVISHVYFPHTGVISNVVDLNAGKEIDTSLIGRDGVFGAGNALDDHIALKRVIARIPGVATVVSAGRMISLADQHQEFRKLVLGYEQFNYAQAQQTAACNASHSVAARCCRWLLRFHDLSGVDLNFTQELIARMLGVRRTSVTEVAVQLAAEDVIRYSRGRLKILDVQKLASRSCECHETLKQAYQRLFPI